MTENFLSLMIRNRHDLLPLVYEFNTLPARYIHMSRVNRYMDLDEPGFQCLIQNPRAEKKLSGIILDKAGLKDHFHWDFELKRLRLALVDGPALLSLIRLAGIAINAGQIIRVIEREPLLALKKSIGLKAYLFALKKAPFLIGKTKFSFIEAQNDYFMFNQYTTRCGAKCLAACFSNAPRPLIKRLGLKLPVEIKGIFEHPFPDQERDAAFMVFKKILLQEVDPQWATFIS